MIRFASVAIVLLSANSIAIAASNNFGDLQVSADSIEVDTNDVMRASGNVVIVDGETTIKLDSASISKENGGVVIEADTVENSTQE
ncbi:hypothetical protein [Chelativorans sp. YIM 93263]|uniref:hypothetical protein n=1 Tax=Chelativorans sp. YIM 93263 TaxID=2906648 RepID=UPI002378AB90|nr:hypothetical protein [Chelativorans sp. YIM 93263]